MSGVRVGEDHQVVTDDQRSPDEWRQANAAARRERLILAVHDMDDAASAARFLLATDGSFWTGFDGLRLRALMETAMFVTYARAFNKSEGDPPLPAAPTKGLSVGQRSIHLWALDRRDRVAAHVDRSAEERIVIPEPVTVFNQETGETSVIEVAERYRPASVEQLEELAGLAELLAQRYRTELFGST